MRSSSRLPFAKWLAPPIGAAIVLVAGSSVALATTLTAGAVVRVPDNPLGGSPTCAALVAKHTALGSVNYPDAEVEPNIAVDPTNPQHLIGSVQQATHQGSAAIGDIAEWTQQLSSLANDLAAKVGTFFGKVRAA